LAKLKSPGPEGRDVEGAETAVGRIDVREIHQREIAAKLLVARDAFVIVEEIAAAVKDETILVDFDRLGVMRGVAVNDGDARLLDQSMSEPALILRRLIAPIRPLMDGDDHDVSRPPDLRELLDDRADCRLGKRG
jgi:hypothetical protein